MKKLYEKSELVFALLWIGAYVVGMSLCDSLSQRIGAEHAITAAIGLCTSVFLLFWLKKNGLLRRFGLCKADISSKAFLWYIPLAVITSRNLWSGVVPQYDAAGTVFFVLKMFSVGFLEELIFRGFLFQAMRRDNVKSAMIVSSITFGLGHIVNLLSGMNLLDNLFQIVSAVAIGFLYVSIFYRGGSLWPCVISHGLLNTCSAFANETVSIEEESILQAVLFLIVIGYTLVLQKTLPRKRQAAE